MRNTAKRTVPGAHISHDKESSYTSGIAFASIGAFGLEADRMETFGMNIISDAVMFA